MYQLNCISCYPWSILVYFGLQGVLAESNGVLQNEVVKCRLFVQVHVKCARDHVWFNCNTLSFTQISRVCLVGVSSCVWPKNWINTPRDNAHSYSPRRISRHRTTWPIWFPLRPDFGLLPPRTRCSRATRRTRAASPRPARQSRSHAHPVTNTPIEKSELETPTH